MTKSPKSPHPLTTGVLELQKELCQSFLPRLAQLPTEARDLGFEWLSDRAAMRPATLEASCTCFSAGFARKSKCWIGRLLGVPHFSSQTVRADNGLFVEVLFRDFVFATFIWLFFSVFPKKNYCLCI